MIINEILIDYVVKTLIFLSLFSAFFLVSKKLKDIITPYNIDEELSKKDNLAVCVTMSGYYVAITLIFIGAFLGPSQGLQSDLLLVSIYTSLGIVALNISRIFNDKIILRKFSNVKEVAEKQNVAVAASQFGVYVATGLIASASVTGQGGGIITFITFFLIGQISLFIFSLIYEKITPYNIHTQLAEQNKSAGIAFGGTLIALGIIVSNGIAGDFISWQENLTKIFVSNILAFILLPVIRLFTDKIVISGEKLSKEISEDKNIGAGLIEATIAISFATILHVII